MKKLSVFLVALLFTLTAGADTKISALPAGTTLAGTEPIPTVQSAATVATTPAAINTYVTSQLQTSGSFTVTYTTGFTVNQTMGFSYLKTGKLVMINATGTATGTSNNGTTSTNVGNWPAALNPSARVLLGPSSAFGANSGASTPVCFDLATNGQLSWSIWSSSTGCGTSWTASGTKTIVGGGWIFVYATP